MPRFAVVSALFEGKFPLKSINKRCECNQCAGKVVNVECFVIDISTGEAMSTPLPPPILLMDCRDLDKYFRDFNFSPFAEPRPRKVLSRLEGYFSFGCVMVWLVIWV